MVPHSSVRWGASFVSLGFRNTHWSQPNPSPRLRLVSRSAEWNIQECQPDHMFLPEVPLLYCQNIIWIILSFEKCLEELILPPLCSHLRHSTSLSKAEEGGNMTRIRKSNSICEILVVSPVPNFWAQICNDLRCRNNCSRLEQILRHREFSGMVIITKDYDCALIWQW